MEKRSVTAKLLHFTAIVLLGLTAIFHLLGGIGTSCVAFFAEKWTSMAALIPYQWLYIVFVLVTLVVAVFAIQATVNLARARAGAFRKALNILIVGLFVSGAHMLASEILRGSSAPTSIRVYLNIFTLVYFLVMRIPGIYETIAFEKDSGSPGGKAGTTAAGAALTLAGITTLTVHLWARSTHTWGNGINYADVWHSQLSVSGWTMVTLGMLILILSLYKAHAVTPACETIGVK